VIPKGGSYLSGIISHYLPFYRKLSDSGILQQFHYERAGPVLVFTPAGPV
jgi:hypothetical protein